MSEEDKELVKKRASFKGRLTAFKNYLNDLNKPMSAAQVNELQLRIGKLEHLYDQYDEVQLRLECNAEDINSQLSERNEFESSYYHTISKAQDILARNSERNESLDCDKSSSKMKTNSKLVKLPTIQLPKFSGSYENWLEFHDTFSSLIHSNDEMDNINKFHYLRASLEGTAAVVIQSIEFSAANYSVAWQLLCDRFDNKPLLIQNHVSAIFSIESLNRENSSSLKRLIDAMNKNLRSLESLGEPTKHWDTLLIHIMTQKLDARTYREWEECKVRFDKDKTIDLKSFTEFLRHRADLLETIEFRTNPSGQGNKASAVRQKALVSVVSTQSGSGGNSSSPSYTCPKCRGDHPLTNCPQFLCLTNEERSALLPQLKVCFNCFRPGHYANRCKKNGCKLCKRRHNTLVHVAAQPAQSTADVKFTANDKSAQPSQVQPVGESKSRLLTAGSRDTLMGDFNHRRDVFLSTALVKMVDSLGQEHIARVLLDSGASCCFMTEELFHTLNPSYLEVDEPIYGVNNTMSPSQRLCRVRMNSLYENYSVDMACYVLPSITDNVPCRPVDVSSLRIPSDVALADPDFHRPSKIDIAAGSDVFWDLLGSGHVKLGTGKPVLWESRLGWLVGGNFHSGHVTQKFTAQCNLAKVDSIGSPHDDDIQSILSRFWQLEEVTPQSIYSGEEKACEEHFVKNVSRLEDGRFSVRVPFKKSTDHLGDSLERAKRCLFSLERRFVGQPLFKERYVDFMTEYQSLGHMSEVQTDDRSTQYFIPHHGVLRESSSTTKLRVVFNASSPTTSGVSLNNLQMVGPTVQDDLLSILLRFRLHRYVLSADVEKMYRQVVVHPQDRPLQQIVWRNDSSDPIKVFQLNTVTYGTASAPFLATRCLKQIGLECDDPMISDVITHDFYVDDLLCATDTLDNAIKIRQGVTAALDASGMPLRKWKSNDSRVITSQVTDSSFDLNIGAIEACKTLGVYWQTDSDELCFKIDLSIAPKITKRSVLSVIAQIFDPMGLLAPCVILMKILLQKLWLHKLSWDDQLPSDVAKVWCEITESLPALNDLRVSRYVMCDSCVALDVHIFTDSSQLAYGACVYVRCVSSDGEVFVRLLLAKSKVAPLKPTTIPRLELCGALLGVRLYEKVMSSITPRATVRSITFWTDSTIVLGWLKTLPSKLQPFVRNRVGDILERAGSHNWRHVPTAENPADHVSRGVHAGSISSLALWWSGPEFLKHDPSQWPPNVVSVESLPELKSEIALHATCEKPISNLIDFKRFSQLQRLIRSVAYVLKFVRLCRKQSSASKFLTKDDLQSSLNLIIKLSQSESFPEYNMLVKGKPLPTKSPLQKFSVFLDDNNIMRVGGRLENSVFAYEKKHPILLQSTHRVTKLLFEYEHLKLMHAGPQLLLASIRENYWPVGGRNLAKSCYHRCVRCTRMRGKIVAPVMGNLPQTRLLPGGHPFECVGVDYAGPLASVSRQGRGCRIVKVYIALFVCFTTKAVHIELVGDLTSNNFLSALRRFISRRGKPTDIFSDNGTSFVGAYNEIGSFLKRSSSSVPESLAKESINFHFIPPYSPHFGGLWEAGVKSVKFHLYRVLGNCNLTYEELSTVLVQIEAILNSRPLTPLSSDPNDLLPLTPGHFLVGRPLTALPVPDLEKHSVSHLTRYQRIEQLRQHFWSRWSKEYISELQQKAKWHSSDTPLKLDTLVLLKEDSLPPMKWRLGRIVTLHPGTDGVSRVADVRTASGIVRRAFSKIAPLLESTPSSC